MELTKDADKLICIFYKSYLEKRKAGSSKTLARNLGSSHYIHQTLCPSWIFEDVDDTCRELSRSGLLDCLWANNVAYQVFLSDSGIFYMENRFKNDLVELTDFISKFIP